MSHYILTKPVPKRETSIMDSIYDKAESVWGSIYEANKLRQQKSAVSKKYNSGFFY